MVHSNLERVVVDAANEMRVLRAAVSMRAKILCKPRPLRGNNEWIIVTNGSLCHAFDVLKPSPHFGARSSQLAEQIFLLSLEAQATKFMKMFDFSFSSA